MFWAVTFSPVFLSFFFFFFFFFFLTGQKFYGSNILSVKTCTLHKTGPDEIKRREVVLDPQVGPEEIKSREVELGLRVGLLLLQLFPNSYGHCLCDCSV